MSFCTSCGHQSEDGHLYCEECGKPLYHGSQPSSPPPLRTASTTATKLPPPNHANHRQFLLLGGGTILVLLLLGLGSYFLLANESATADHLQAAAKRYLLSHPEYGRERYCLSDFAYQKDPVVVAGYDTATQQWLNALVEAGIYNAAQALPGNSFGTAANLQYSKTESGKIATRTGALCAAGGLQVTNVNGIQELPSQQTAKVSAQLTLTLKDPLDWISHPAVARRISGRAENFQLRARFQIRERKWEVFASASESDTEEAKVQDNGMQLHAPALAATGLWSWLSPLFSFANRPTTGK